MRFVVLGTSEITVCCAHALLDSGGEVCAVISMPPHIRTDNSVDVASFAEGNKIPYHEVEDINSPRSVDLLRRCSPDYIFSSWPKILRKETLEIPRIYCIGTHPTELPFNRGRHPLHWLIIQGISETELSFFRMDAKVDSGNVLIQVPFEIAHDDSIVDVVAKMNSAAYEGTRNLYKKLFDDPIFSGTEQDHTIANYWRKRTPHDVTLDLRMSADMIIRTVRSFTLPYPCANLLFDKYVIKIVEAALAPIELSFKELQRMEAGKIIEINDKRIRIKADDRIVDLICKDRLPDKLLQAQYIHMPTKYLAEYPNILAKQLR